MSTRRKCCSCCKIAGHYISTCNSSHLRDFETSCLRAITSFDNNIELNFQNFLLTEYFLATDRSNLHLVKSFAIRYCRVTLRTNLNIYINSILIYFKPVIDFREEITCNRIINDNAYQEVINFISNSANVLQENNSMAMMYGLLFMELIMTIHETSKNQRRKFNIKMNLKKDDTKVIEICGCNICYEEYENRNFVNFDCGHKFCKDCVKNSLQNEKKEKYCCAFCRKEIKNFNFTEEAFMDEFNTLIT